MDRYQKQKEKKLRPLNRVLPAATEVEEDMRISGRVNQPFTNAVPVGVKISPLHYGSWDTAPPSHTGN